MSRLYEMTVRIKGVPEEKLCKVKSIAATLWSFEAWEQDESTLLNKTFDLSSTGRCNLGGGRTEGDFARELARKIWRAAGRYVLVTVTAVYLEDPPTEVHLFDYEHYVRHGPWQFPDEEHGEDE